MPCSSAEARISPMPNSPMVTGTKPMPDSSEMDPKLSRWLPVSVSKPTAARSRTNASMAMAFAGDSAPSPTSVVNDSTKTAKSSGGPNESAFSAIHWAKNVMSTVAMNAPTNDARNDDVSASPGLPRFLASGKPSNSSTTDHGSPGMLKRIDVMTPPNSAPQ